MNKLINKNFEFLNNEKIHFKNKNEVIKLINKVHIDICNNNISYSLVDLRKTGELVLANFLEFNGINSEQKTLGGMLWETEKHFGNSFEPKIRDSYHILRMKGNSNAHSNEVPLKSDVVVCFKAIREIIWNSFGIEENLIEKFDESIYFLKNNVDDLLNSKKTKEFYLPLDSRKDISISQNSLINWMSFKEKVLMIPIYQRGYTWTVEQVETLFNDIVKRNEDNSLHYFGIIACKKISINSTSLNDRLKIIDGQQRLTTSFLFICAIREVISKTLGVNIEDEKTLYEILRINEVKNKIEDYFYNPGGTEKNNSSFRKILIGDIEGIDQKNQYFINFKKFEELINNLVINKQWDLSQLRDLTHTFLTKFELAEIFFNDTVITNKKEMEIFENLNSKGKELTVEDLIKNFIFNLCSENLLESKGETEIPQKYNLYILNELDNNPKIVTEFFKTLTQYSKGGETSKNRQLQLNDLKETIHNLFEIKQKDELSKINEYDNLLLDIKDYVVIYFDVMEKNIKDICKWLGIDKIIKLCNEKKKVSLFLGLVFLMMEFFKRNNRYDLTIQLKEGEKKEIKKLFLILMKAIVKNTIITTQGDSSFKRNILKHVYDIRKDFLANKNISINDIFQSFQSKIFSETDNNNFYQKLVNNSGTSKAITWLLILTEWDMSDQLLEYQSPSIEHIMPQNKKNWEKDLSFEKDFTELEYKTTINKIGNYFILNKGKNSEVSNYSFNKKKIIYKTNTSPLFNNPNNSKIDISRKTDWTFNKIEERTKALIKYIAENVIN